MNNILLIWSVVVLLIIVNLAIVKLTNMPSIKNHSWAYVQRPGITRKIVNGGTNRNPNGTGGNLIKNLQHAKDF